MQIKGIYRHFKGREYEVFGAAIDRDTQEKYVLYRKLYGDMSYWIRPYDMFMGEVETQCGRVKRFERIRNSETDIDFDDEIFYICATHSENQEEYGIAGTENTESEKIYIVKREK